MHDSFTPLGGLIPLWLIQLGEVIFGGVGSGLYGMLVFAIVAVFIAGLMVGRTPEYLGKKIEAFEMKMASLVILIPPFCALVGTAIAVSLRGRPRRHGQSGRARLLGDSLRLLFGGRQQRQRVRGPVGQHAVLQHALGIAMWVSRYWLDRAGARDRRQPRRKEERPRQRRHAAARTRRCSWCCSPRRCVIVGALAFFPALALGPIVEELQFLAH